MNLVVCQHCERHLRIKQQLQNTKLKCRFCGAIFVGSAQSTEGAYAAAPDKPQKRAKPMRYVRIRRKMEVVETPTETRPAEIAAEAGPVEVFATSNPEIAKRPEIAPATQQQPRIAALKAETQVIEAPEDTFASGDSYQPTPKPAPDPVVEMEVETDTEAKTAEAEQIPPAVKPVKKREIHIPQPATKPVNKPNSEPQPVAEKEVVAEQIIEAKKAMDNQQLTPNPQMIETQSTDEPTVEVPVIIAPVEESAVKPVDAPENSASPTAKKSQKLKWIIAAAAVCAVGGIAWTITVSL